MFDGSMTYRPLPLLLRLSPRRAFRSRLPLPPCTASDTSLISGTSIDAAKFKGCVFSILTPNVIPVASSTKNSGSSTLLKSTPKPNSNRPKASANTSAPAPDVTELNTVAPPSKSNVSWASPGNWSASNEKDNKSTKCFSK